MGGAQLYLEQVVGAIDSAIGAGLHAARHLSAWRSTVKWCRMLCLLLTVVHRIFFLRKIPTVNNLRQYEVSAGGTSPVICGITSPIITGHSLRVCFLRRVIRLTGIVENGMIRMRAHLAIVLIIIP